MPKCPVCDAVVDLATSPTVPFCSDRCRLIDLGRWLDEGYSVPLPRQPGLFDPDMDDDADPHAGT